MNEAAARTPQMLDTEQVRRDFPALNQSVNGKPLIYLDNAASAQKPEAVLDAMDRYYRESHSNVHRGAHTLGDRATMAFEGRAGNGARISQRQQHQRDRLGARCH